ncbi:MAG: phosphoglycerate kinase [Candidatus Caldarchaeum sp.]|nr:phosphoglycerate kinase [Candidatus Caldarchaeum sp.]
MERGSEVKFRTIDDLEVSRKRIAVRVDLNSSIDPKTGEVIVNERFRAHATTVRELLGKGGKVVVLAHQGRRGDPDFKDLSQHARIFSSYVGQNVRFVPDVVGNEAVEAIRTLDSGQAILLDNVRKLEDEDVDKAPEEHAKSTLPRTLAPYFDAFVLDAFSIAHRSHSSIVGLAALLPTYAGRVMEKELSALNKISLAQKLVFLLGGNKPQECVKVLTRFLEKKPASVEKVMTGGILGQLVLASRGYRLGQPTEEMLAKKKHLDLLPKVSYVDEKTGDRMLRPLDFAYLGKDGSRYEISVEQLPCPAEIQDIGTKTINHFCAVLENLEPDSCVVVKGPVGVYEKPEFRKGTEAVYHSLRRTKASTLIGGGDSATVIDILGMSPSDFSFVSLGGGAFITYLSGEPLPGLQVLAKY